MTAVWVGTSGWSYDHWEPELYPPGLPALGQGAARACSYPGHAASATGAVVVFGTRVLAARWSSMNAPAMAASSAQPAVTR